MNRENDILYVETDSGDKKKEPKALGLLSLIFGIASVVLAGPLGIVLGGLAQRFASIILDSDFGGATAVRARVGQITGSVGLCLSVVAVSLFVLILTAGIWLAVYLISGNPIFF